jgi:hypothetical protein
VLEKRNLKWEVLRFLQLCFERDELLLFLFKVSQPRIDSGDIMKFISAAILIRDELEVV